MKSIKNIVDFYINSSVHVAFAVFSFVRITEIYFQLPFQKNLNFFIFFATITGYNFVKYAGVAKLHHRSLTNSLKIIQFFSFFCFLFMCYFAAQIQIEILLYSVPFYCLTLLYAIPFLSGFSKNLREISYLKIIIVALVWVGFTFIIPLLNTSTHFGIKSVLLGVQRFLLVIVLLLPFDIRDVKYDAISLQTIPKKIGVLKTKQLGVLLLVICCILEYLAVETNSLYLPFILFFVMIFAFLIRSKMDQSKYYSSFWVESLPIFWWLFLLGFLNF
ncbi:hypothetical protein [Polaribacter sp.]|uniref:hypothetical protein n=1 Tax=Polaribacter sp. TaxID=1920175 RepID=UPI003F6A1064